MMTLGKIGRIGRREEQSRNRLWTMLDRYNPIAGLSLLEAQQIYDGARCGDYYRIQYIYQEIERTDPTLLTCVERRVSAISGLGWRVSPTAGDIDSELADEQRDALTGYFRDIVNLPECVEHLALAFFRGYAHAILRGDAFDLLPSWAIGRDMQTREWLWRPQGRGGETLPLETDGLVTVVHDRPIDYPALSIYIRSALAERDWGRFVERYGLPPCTLISPPDATPEQAEEFRRAAEAAADGLSMSLPSGSQVSFAAEARGVNPFLEFVQHQQKQIVLLATGGTLTSLAESGTGTLAGNAQMDVWREIVRRDAELIGNALHRSIAIPYLRRMFPGQPIAAEFSLGRDAEPTPTEMFELAAKAVAAGYRISRDELSEATGYTLEDAQPSQPGNGGFGGFAANTDAGRAENRCKPIANPLQNARSDLDGENTAEGARGPQIANFGVLAETALQKDLDPVLSELSELGNLPEEEQRRRAAKLLDRLTEDAPSADSLSDVMELAMACSVSENETIKNDDRESDGKFAKKGTGDRTGKAEEQEASEDVSESQEESALKASSKSSSTKDSDSDRSGREEKPYDSTAAKANMEAGKAAIEKVLSTKETVSGAMERKSTGKIDFVWGKTGTQEKNYEDGYGFAKILRKHKADIPYIAGTLAFGDIYEDTNGDLLAIKKRVIVILRKDPVGNAYLITGYRKENSTIVLEKRKRGKLLEKGPDS